MTVTQQQLILAWFGCLPPKSVDGIKGPQTEAAIKKLQGILGIAQTGEFDQNTEGEALNAMLNGWQPTEERFWDHIKYWTREEFRCQCGGKYCDGFPAEPAQNLVELLDDVREHFGRPGLRSSGLRCKVWNGLQGGVETSRHMYGKAMDFRIDGYTAAQVLEYVNNHTGARYAYDIDGTYVHVDVD